MSHLDLMGLALLLQMVQIGLLGSCWAEIRADRQRLLRLYGRVLEAWRAAELAKVDADLKAQGPPA